MGRRGNRRRSACGRRLPRGDPRVRARYGMVATRDRPVRPLERVDGDPRSGRGRRDRRRARAAFESARPVGGAGGCDGDGPLRHPASSAGRCLPGRVRDRDRSLRRSRSRHDLGWPRRVVTRRPAPVDRVLRDEDDMGTHHRDRPHRRLHHRGACRTGSPPCRGVRRSYGRRDRPSRSADRAARTVSGCSAPRCVARISAQRA